MLPFRRWRRWALIAMIILSLIIFRFCQNSGIGNFDAMEYLTGERSDKSHRRPIMTLQGKSDVQVVVGHYVGDLSKSGFSVANITQELLNTNFFSPVPGEGHYGLPVIIPPQETLKMQKLFAINRFNLLASDRIPLNRSLPDVRRKRCQDYYNESVAAEKALDVSIIIIFHNEAWSTLLRTVTSVVNRSPRSLLKEVILVDDASEREFLGRPLEEYVKSMPVSIRILRTHVRSGLVRARLLGARAALGEILVFLDAHCECTIGWLQPLVMRIAEKRTHVVCPVIDIINENTFAYVRSFELHWGAFNWHLHFRWYALGRDDIRKRKMNALSPFKTPAMAGGLFAIDRNYFFEIGSYDEDMDIWGGENLEMSFRVWQCGGSVEIAPCSHVGHLFRKSSPYSFPGGIGDVLLTNLARVAIVWMDEWADFFFHLNPEAAKLRNSIVVKKRQQLRHQLQCRNFHWYLTAVWPEHFFPMDDRFFGQVKQHVYHLCLQKPTGSLHHPVGYVTLNACGIHSNSTLNGVLQQVFVFDASEGPIMTDESACLDTSAGAHQDSKPYLRVMMLACTGTERQKWSYKRMERSMVHISTGLCLDVLGSAVSSNSSDLNSSSKLVLNNCNAAMGSQQWDLNPIPWKI